MACEKFVLHTAPLSLCGLFGMMDDHYVVTVQLRLRELIFDATNVELV